MHVNHSWLKVEERLTSSLLVFMRGIDLLNAPSCLFELLAHSSDTHAYPTRHEVSSQSPSPEQTMEGATVLNRAMTTCNSIPHPVPHASSKICFGKQIKKTSHRTAGTVKQHKHRHRNMHTHTHTIAYAPYTHVHMDFVLYICGSGGVGA